MPATYSQHSANGIEFHVEEGGSGEPLVLVHGGWGSSDRWAFIVDGLAQSHHVVTYDRRGHGESQTSAVPPTRRDQEDDLAGLIEAVGVAPAHLVGSSFGGSIALSLAARRPDLVRSVCVHEPPLLGFAADDALVRRANEVVAEVAELIEAGTPEQAAREFVERVALGPGGWDMMPAEGRAAMVRHAGAFAGEQRDADWAAADLEGIECPVLLTCGDQSPEWFAPVIAGLRAALPQADVVTIRGSGHVPHITHPGEYAELLARFAVTASAA